MSRYGCPEGLAHMCRAQAAEAEAKALREQQALENALKLQALREKWNVDKAHTEVSAVTVCQRL